MRTVEELLSSISHDIVWRKKELTELKSMLDSHEGKIKQRVLVRAAVALLYAHWEGFVKKAAGYYVKHVAMQRENLDRLQTNFLVLSARASSDFSSGGFKHGIHLAEFYLRCSGKRANVPYKNVIDTRSNLGSNVLKEILLILGFDESYFSTRFKFIDSNLVSPRNHVAHGEEISITFEEYEVLHHDVLSMIEEFRNMIENAAATRQYLK